MMTLTPKHRLWDVWLDFITMFACALSNRFDKAHFEERENTYMRIIQKYDPDEQKVFPELVADMVMALEENQEQDFLGSAYMELELGNDHAGQVFTPYDVCNAMAILTCRGCASRILEEGYVTISDPACGAGATLIAAVCDIRKQLAVLGYNWQNHVLIAAQDIDYTVGLMCYIQLSLLGAAAYVKIGDSIADPMRSGDDTKNYWYTPMYFSDVWQMRRIWRSVDRLFSNDKKLHEEENSGKE